MVRVKALGTDAGDGTRSKALGYGRPLQITLDAGDSQREIVFHAIKSDDFGHDRRADRIACVVGAHETFARMPRHVRALDVGVLAEPELTSLANAGEPYFITEWAPGTIYAEDLRRVATQGAASKLDLRRIDALVGVLHEIHAMPGSHPGAYARAIRDLIGDGEGVFGLVDSYAADTPGVPLERLRRIEESCLRWRWKLKHRTQRLRCTHGDFHPFNILFDHDAELTLLDASRGGEGDPADDVACLAINFVFFALGDRRRRPGLAALWTRFWDRYLANDPVDVLAAVAPFFAWRGLVLASPRWYPDLATANRVRLLDFVERVLAANRFESGLGPRGADMTGGCVVWITGPPAAGKTTLAQDTARRLRERQARCIVLDGDAVRLALVPSRAFHPEGRAAFYTTLARLAALVATQDTIVLVAATAHLRTFRDHARSISRTFIEVHVDTPVDECRRRDPKGLYRAGSAELPGAALDYEATAAARFGDPAGDDDAAERLADRLAPVLAAD